MQEEIISDLRYALSPDTFSREILEITPDPWQIEVMMSPAKRILLNCSRQSGKSTSSAIIALHRALYHPGSLILLISPSLRQSSELFKKVQSFYKMLPDKSKLKEDNKLSMVLDNQSRIISLPSGEATIRGFSGVDLIIEDEASRVDDSLYYAIRPMLAVSGGKIMLMSTPWGKRGHFFEEWTGPNDWQRVKIPATDCPRISPEFLEEERKSLGDWWFDQEYMCEFGDTSDSLFRYDDIEAAFRDDIEPLRLDEPDPIPNIQKYQGKDVEALVID